MNDNSFEKALEELEAIVEELEKGNLPLEESLKKFERGIKLARFCDKKLKEAQKRILVLTKDLEGQMDTVPFSLEKEPAEEEMEEDL